LAFLEPHTRINRKNVGQLVNFKCLVPLKQHSIMFYVIWFEAWPFWYLVDKSDQCTLVVTWTLFSICERLNNEEIHGDLTLRSGEQLHSIFLMNHIFWCCTKFLFYAKFFSYFCTYVVWRGHVLSTITHTLLQILCKHDGLLDRTKCLSSLPLLWR